jgi:predicted ATPase/DNA-binding SARP family transcriptional activator
MHMADAASPLTFRLLGPVEAVRNGSTLALGGARQRALLGLLLVEHGRTVPAERLSEELWQGRPPAAAQTTLRSYVSRLRRVLGDEASIRANGAGYVLSVEPEQVDLLRFEQLVREGDLALERGAAQRGAERLREALALWRGRAFGELADEGALRLEAARLEDLRLYCLERRLQADLALGRSAELVEELEALVHRHPERERFWAQLMLALYRAQRQAEALEAYRRARSHLDEHLGLEPSEELKALEQAILRHEVEPALPPEERHNLPAQLTSFIGRKRELEEVGELLEQARVVTLTGVGGAGKTRLALEAARRAVSDFPDGVWFCDFSPVAEETLVSRRLAAALGVREQADTPLEESLVRHLSGKELLLVLDNCEHVRETCAHLAQRVLTFSPRVHILATSREILGSAGEVDFAVPPLSLADPAAGAEELRRSEAVRLFLTRAREARPHLTEDDATLASAARIAEDLDGLPLAIELAAARAKALSLDDIATRLRDRFRFLVSWRRLTTARHRTLAEAMDWSYELLSEDERGLLARLSVFVGTFSLPDVAGVCLDGDEDRALELLERLIDASLVVPVERGEDMHYRLLETVRQYGAGHLAEGGETEDLQRRHAEYFASWAEKQNELRAVLSVWVELLAPAEHNLRAALEWSRDAHAAELMLRIVAAIWRYWWVRGDFSEGRAWLQTAVDGGRDIDARLRAEAFEGAAGLAWAHGDMSAAAEHAEAARQLYLDIGDGRGESAGLTVLGHVALEREDYEAAESFFQTVVAVQAKNGVPLGISYHNLASTAFGRGDFELAVERYQRALEEFRKHDDEYGIALSELYLAMVAIEEGQYDEAAAYLRHPLVVFREMGFLQYSAQCLDLIGPVVRERGDAAEATRLFAGAHALRKRTGQAPTVAARRRERDTEAARVQLSAEEFDAAWAEGLALRENELFDLAERALAD